MTHDAASTSTTMPRRGVRAVRPHARPLGEMRAGALLVRERWASALGAPVRGTRRRRRTLPASRSPTRRRCSTRGIRAGGTWLVNARSLPQLTRLRGRRTPCSLRGDASPPCACARRSPCVALLGGRRGPRVARAGGRRAQRSSTGGWWRDEVWDYVAHLVPMLGTTSPVLGAAMPRGARRAAAGRDPRSARIRCTSRRAPRSSRRVSSTRRRPVLLRGGAHVLPSRGWSGPLYVGAGTTVTADRIAASSHRRHRARCTAS